MNQKENMLPLTVLEITARAKAAGLMPPILTMQINFAEKQPPVPTDLKPFRTSDGTVFIRT